MSTFCTHCGNSIEGQDQFCRKCGTPAGTATATPIANTESGRTSTKAIISLICGLFLFFFPLSVVAVILGHISLSEIKKSAGRLTGEGMATAGLVLGYVGVAAIPIILIMAAIAIPNLLRARMAANESVAVASVRTIVTAQMTYSESHPQVGYACSLSTLDETQIIGAELASGQRSGYRFEIKACVPDAQDGITKKYQIVAYPITANQSGIRAFCSDESGVIKINAGGSVQGCLEEGVALQ